ILLSTHLVEDVAAICTRVIVLHQGRVLFKGTPTELRARADGMVWRTADVPSGATASWRTEEGWIRAIGSQPSAEAEAMARTVEDGYLLVTSSTQELTT